MSVAFWSCELKKGSPAVVSPPEGYVLNLQQAAIIADDNCDAVHVFCKTEDIEGSEKETLLCTLRPKKTGNIIRSLGSLHFEFSSYSICSFRRPMLSSARLWL
jgi:hypothetical protein